MVRFGSPSRAFLAKIRIVICSLGSKAASAGGRPPCTPAALRFACYAGGLSLRSHACGMAVARATALAQDFVICPASLGSGQPSAVLCATRRMARMQRRTACFPLTHLCQVRGLPLFRFSAVFHPSNINRVEDYSGLYVKIIINYFIYII